MRTLRGHWLCAWCHAQNGHWAHPVCWRCGRDIEEETE